MTSIMDMYSILGVKTTSSLQDVRKAYIDLARICHPDKGGRVEDMRVLKTTYDWICNQLQLVALESEKGTFEERELEYQAYIKKQQDQEKENAATPLPSMVEIELSMYVSNSETFSEIQKRISDRFPDDAFMRDICLRRVCFHKDITEREDLLCVLDKILDDVDAIRQQGSIPASIPGGYGDLLYPSCDNSVLTTPTTPTSFGRMELVLHKEPVGELVVWRTRDRASASTCTEIPIPRALSDYSVGSLLTDYRVAYTDTTHASRQLEDMYNANGAFTHTYDAVIETRKQQDNMFQNSAKEQVTLTFRS